MRPSQDPRTGSDVLFLYLSTLMTAVLGSDAGGLFDAAGSGERVDACRARWRVSPAC